MNNKYYEKSKIVERNAGFFGNLACPDKEFFKLAISGGKFGFVFINPCAARQSHKWCWLAGQSIL